MNLPSLSTRFAGWTLWALTCGSVLSCARAETRTAPQMLGTYVVSAARLPQDPQSTPSAVTLLPLAELQAAQIGDLRTALTMTPGVAIAASGAMGAQNSVFIRGASSHQTLFVVDGVRMNSRNAGYQNFLGGADLLGLDRVEVLRGPQSTLYGSAAMGGVVLLETARGCGPVSGTVSAQGGSFDTWGAAATAQGGTATVGYSAAVSHVETANDRPGNDYQQWSYAARLEAVVAAPLLVGATWRSQLGDYEEPGSRLYPAPGKVDAQNHLVTAYGEWRPTAEWHSRLTAGLHRRTYEYGQAWGTSAMSNTREVLDWQNNWTPTRAVQWVAGASLERARYRVAGDRTDDDATAAYVSGGWQPAPGTHVTAGGRYDDFDTAGSATTWRAGVAQMVPGTGWKWRATYGTGFTAPGSDDRFGVPSWGQKANPGLRPEKSRGWDAGVDYALAGGQATVSATYFHNRFRDLFEWETTNYQTFAGWIVNRARATTQGVELAAEARWAATVQGRVTYTYLDARNDVTGAALARRPRHAGGAEVRWQATPALLLGVGANVNAARFDAGKRQEDYTTARVFASYDVTPAFRLKARLENALDERYESVLGYPALPFGAFGGVEWRF